MKLIDTHTHKLSPSGIVNCQIGQTLEPNILYSVGHHPWNTSPFDETQLIAQADLPQIVAIGECGLDNLRGPNLQRQQQIFSSHIHASETLRKPLIIHCVKAIDTLLAMKKESSPTQPWILHSFRGKPQQAMQLIDQGLHLSLGPKFNPATAAIIPPDRLLIETDDSALTIEQIASQIAQARGTTPAQTLHLAATNLNRLIDPHPKTPSL